MDKYIQKPVIDEDKLFILSSIINNTSLSEVKKRHYIITTMLVQVALDTHDLVQVESDNYETNHNKKKQQLTVLAGTYYSGLYYNLLSELDDIPMIYTLASAIKEINEQKMTIYYCEVDSYQDFMESLKKIESVLIFRVAEYMKRSSVNEVVGDWLLTRKLIYEKASYLKKGVSPIFDLLVKGSNSNVNYPQITSVVENLIQNNVTRLEITLSQLPVHFNSIKAYVNTMIYNNICTNSKVAEEG